MDDILFINQQTGTSVFQEQKDLERLKSIKSSYSKPFFSPIQKSLSTSSNTSSKPFVQSDNKPLAWDLL